MTCTCCVHSAFRWRERTEPGLFASDPKFCIAAKSGKTMSQIASAATDRVTRETGRNPGSIFGISDQADRRAEEFQRMRRAG